MAPISFAQADWLKTNEGCRVFMNKLPEKADASWSGPCVDGRASGAGTMKMTTERENGPRTSSITGRMRNGRFSGKVRILPGNGDRLEGELVDGKLRAAKVIFADGRRYDGPIENGLPNGVGTMIYPDGLRYVGTLANGVRQGQGEATYENGARYRGGWRFDLRHGAGTYTTARDMVISGTFRDGELHGRARFARKDGTWFEGPTRNQTPHGKGVCGSTRDGQTRPCEFRKGKFLR